jgi:hypothetical protein
MSGTKIITDPAKYTTENGFIVEVNKAHEANLAQAQNKIKK